MSDSSDQSPDNSPLLPHGGYEKLRSYKVAEAVYDATVVFCDRFIPKRSRTHDQMVQAARSGVRNISEGSGAAATSRKSEMKLTNVARASLNDELLKDYKSFLMQNGLRVWHKDSPEAKAMRERLKHDLAPDLPPAKPGRPLLTGLAGLSAFVREATPELAANAMLCAVNQAAYLLKRQLEKQAREFIEKGGITESLHATRAEARAARGTSPDGPPCPLCGQPTRRHTAGKGPRAGKAFWGCSRYPDCRGILDIPSAESDLSDSSGLSDNIYRQHLAPMSTQRYSVTPQPIDTLLAWVKSGEIAIPEIQRPFVWEPIKVRNLLDSLYQGYPVGYLIAWRNPTVKLKDGTLSAGKRILIDGQQRVTALMAGLLGREVLTKDYVEKNPETKTSRVPSAPTGRRHTSPGQRPGLRVTPPIPAPTGRHIRNGGAA